MKNEEVIIICITIVFLYVSLNVKYFPDSSGFASCEITVCVQKNTLYKKQNTGIVALILFTLAQFSSLSNSYCGICRKL